MQEGKQFRVMVVDSRPHYEGKAMLAKLLAHGIPCTYLHLNALCYSMQVHPSTPFTTSYRVTALSLYQHTPLQRFAWG